MRPALRVVLVLRVAGLRAARAPLRPPLADFLARAFTPPRAELRLAAAGRLDLRVFEPAAFFPLFAAELFLGFRLILASN
ncbi:MAG: hypothetical protein M3007_04400 [Candidatus Eremiobacteraeota bacterium]|nr:hypothetical protein [Candidatus Eremiobacteraeota bacterium]